MESPFQHLRVEKLGEIGSDRLRRLFAYWELKRGNRPRPKWSDMELMDIHDIMPFVYVKDLIEDGSNFQYRYWGTYLSHYLGYDMSGKTARDHYTGEHLVMTIDRHVELLQAGEPLISTGKVMWARDQECKAYTGLALPFDGEAAPLRHLMFAFEFDT